MPNQGNKSNGKSGIVQGKKSSTMPSTDKKDAKSGADKNSGSEKSSSAKSGKSGKG